MPCREYNFMSEPVFFVRKMVNIGLELQMTPVYINISDFGSNIPPYYSEYSNYCLSG